MTATFTGTAATPQIRLTWTPGVDETAGERDVEKYVIYRRTLAGDVRRRAPVDPRGPGQPTPSTTRAVLNDSTYIYGVTALDCTPLESTAVLDRGR